MWLHQDGGTASVQPSAEEVKTKEAAGTVERVVTIYRYPLEIEIQVSSDLNPVAWNGGIRIPRYIPRKIIFYWLNFNWMISNHFPRNGWKSPISSI